PRAGKRGKSQAKIMAKIPLYEYLNSQPSAPNAHFDRFVVGNISIQRAYLSASLNSMLNGTKPSHLQLILGPNGNGKTLLNNTLMYEASNKNLTRTESGDVEAKFTVLFSHITLNDANQNSIGIRLAQSLKRSIYEPSRQTYAAIAAKIIEDFALNYEFPFQVRLSAWWPRSVLKRDLSTYGELINRLLSDEDVDSTVSALEKTFLKLQKSAAAVPIRESFEEYLRVREVNPFMRNYLENRSDSLSVSELNRALFTDLSSFQGTAQPLDVIKAISSMAQSVDCKLLILAVDDFNLKQPPTVLLPIVEKLSEFTNPKILFVVSAVQAVWEKAIADEDDLSIRQKIHQFGNPIIVAPPSEHDMDVLFDKIVSLMNADLAREGKSIIMTPQEAQSLRSYCPRSSYRDAIKYLIDNLRHFVEIPSQKMVVRV
ncbi:MAG: hypothetical protein L0Z71_04975, partial [Anaerolineae bacterium]|nr:hypothetical protein [Anaerolineae bacterium]